MDAETTLSLHAARTFADKYAKIKSESQWAQSFWRDFFIDVVGVRDLLIAGVEFEHPVRMASTGKIGFIDTLWSGVVLVEHKSAGESLEKAETQAREYLASLDSVKRPRFFIVSDFRRIRIVDTIDANKHEFLLKDLPENLHRLDGVVKGHVNRATGVEVDADTKAAQLMGKLFIEFENAGYEGHEVSIFLMRCLFLCFGDDTNLWRRGDIGLFEALVDASATDGHDLGGTLQELFQVLNTPREKRPKTTSKILDSFPYVNGGLFSESLRVFSFTPDMRQALVDAGKYSWKHVNPAIFGAMFQTIKDKEARKELGEHFTSVANILKVIGPLFLADFNEKLQKNWDSPAGLRRFHDELGLYTFCDFALGCGNFLLLSYKQLREIELKLLARLQYLEGRQLYVGLEGTWGLKIHLSNFYGVEIEEWSSQIARVAMFIAEHQSNLAMEEILGTSPSLLPLNESANIVHGNALEIEWDSVCPMNEYTMIMGNPPFNGARIQSDSQKKDTERVWDGIKGAGNVDYVANWFLVAARHLAKSGGRAGLVATNSITQGEIPPLLWPPLYDLGIQIDFAHRSFAWDNDAPGQAGVHCVIIGFSVDGPSGKKPLWTYATPKGQPKLSLAKNINPYLLDAPNVLITSRSTPLDGHTQPLTYGSQPNDNGWLSDINEDEAKEIRKNDPIAAKYLKRIVGAQEILHGEIRYCLWLVDAKSSEIKASPELRKRVREVRNIRLASKRPVTNELAKTPYLFGFISHPKTSYLAVPLHSSEEREYVPIARLTANTIATNAVSIIADGSLTSFGLIQSKPFNLWNKAVSGRLESRVRISSGITYNNFPFPSLTNEQKNAIENAAQAVLDARDSHSPDTLADLYDKEAMPANLRKAHKKLDDEVLKAMGLKPTSSYEKILEALFDLYSEANATLFTDEEITPKKKRK